MSGLFGSRDRLVRTVVCSLEGSLRPGCRILNVEGSPGRFSQALARALPGCTVILISADGRMRNRTGSTPLNLEVLSCEPRAANFLPHSLAAVIAEWEPAQRLPDLISTLIEWLEPGGMLILLRGRFPWPRWFTIAWRRRGELNGQAPAFDGFSRIEFSTAGVIFRKCV